MATNVIITQQHQTAAPAVPTVDQLSFTAGRLEDGVTLWSPSSIPTGWAEQCGLGRELAREAIDYIAASYDSALLPGIVRTIVERGSFGGVEAGFFTEISEQL